MNGLIANLLGLAIGLGICATGIDAWRGRRMRGQRQREAAARRRERDRELGQAEAAQRAASLAQRELALSQLARRREALKRQRDTAAGEPSRLGQAAATTPLGVQPSSANDLGLLPVEPESDAAPSPQGLQRAVAESDSLVAPGETTADAPSRVEQTLGRTEEPQRDPLPNSQPIGGSEGLGIAVETAAPSADSADTDPHVAGHVHPDEPAAPTVSADARPVESEVPEVVPHTASPRFVDAGGTQPLRTALGAALDPPPASEARIFDIPAEVAGTRSTGGELPSPGKSVDVAGVDVESGLEQSAQAPIHPVVKVDTDPSPSLDSLSSVLAEAAFEGSDVDLIGETRRPVEATVGGSSGNPAQSLPQAPSPPFELSDVQALPEVDDDAPESAEASYPPAKADPPFAEGAPSATGRAQVPDATIEADPLAAVSADHRSPPDMPVADSAVPGALRPRRAPARRFRPSVQDPSRVTAIKPRAATAVPRDRPLAIDLRLKMYRGGRCALTLVGRRNDELPEQLTVAADHGTVDLTAMQEGWFEDVHSNYLGSELQTGVQWTLEAGEGCTRWLLSGRSVFVLAEHQQLSGVVNTTRLELGQTHVVLCTQERADEVRAALAACGAHPSGESGAAHGMPAPWIAFHGVVPTKPVQASSESSDLDCLCPRSDAQLHVTGGIRLEGSIWLAGFPPHISLHGDPATVGDVFIDQKLAQLGDDGYLTVPGWDATGAHRIACSVGTRSYSIQDPPRAWAPWSQSSTETPLQGDRGGRSVCGALVRKYQTGDANMHTVLVPSTNTLLIGAEPGQICVCEGASHLPATAPRVGFPAFDPVWAAPQRPLRCDKRHTSVLLLPASAPTMPVSPSTPLQRARRAPLKPEVQAWCDAILDASRKGLVVSPADPAAQALWKAYRTLARSMTRGVR
jgi:hypothetical protein